MSQAPRFPLTSEQCELLVAFEDCASLAELARVVGRDPSVVLRQVQRVAEIAPVLEKVAGRWALTERGRHICAWARHAVAAQRKILARASEDDVALGALPALDLSTALVLVNVQRALVQAARGPCSNPDVTTNITALVTLWRQRGLPIAFARHEAASLTSDLAPGSQGAAHPPDLAPEDGDIAVAKTTNSAFVGTALEARLRERGVTTVVVCGFTTNYCVDATARSAADLGLRCFVVDDATAAFDVEGPDGRVLRAQDAHAFALANLHAEYATILDVAAVQGLFFAQPLASCPL